MCRLIIKFTDLQINTLAYLWCNISFLLYFLLILYHKLLLIAIINKTVLGSFQIFAIFAKTKIVVKYFKISKKSINATKIFLLCICIRPGIHFNMIDKRYVPIPKEVDLCRMKWICEKFEMKAVVQLYRKQHPLQFSTRTKQYPPEKTCLNFVFLLCLPLLYWMTLGQWVFLTHNIYYSTVPPLND